jgi:hypothetical protein
MRGVGWQQSTQRGNAVSVDSARLPDITLSINAIIAEDDMVALHATM